MAEPLRMLHPVAEDADENNVSPVSSRRGHPSPIKDFSPSNFFRRDGYQKMDADGAQEMVFLDESGQQPRAVPSSSPPPPQLPPIGKTSPELGVGGLGISGLPSRNSSTTSGKAGSNRHSFHRKPVRSTTSPPDTPGSHHGLLGSTASTAPSTPMASGHTGGPSPMPPSHSRNRSSWNGQSSFVEGAAHLSPPPGSDDGPGKHLGSPATTTSARGTPGELDTRGELPDEGFDDELFYKGFGQPPSYCSSRGDIHKKRTSWLSITIFVLSIYSTVMSGIWLVVAILQPRWGRGISSREGLNPSTATTLSALISKTIEMTFVTVFVACLGQILTRRAFVRNTIGMTLGEMTMRNWVFQPGSLITHAETIPNAGSTILGALALTATVAATFYTTASDAMVAPKLKYGEWESKELSAHIRASYANPEWVKTVCPSVLGDEDEQYAAESCLNIQFSGQSYRNLRNYMQAWTTINDNSTEALDKLEDRPGGTTLLFDNTTLIGDWIETGAGDVAANFERYSRIINNVTLAMPHPGVYGAAMDKVNGILQPSDLDGVGEYTIKAGVVSPSVNVMCVNMDKEELAPLVYTEWPGSETEKTGVGKQTIGHDTWVNEVPKPEDKDGEKNYLNRTAVDDIFRWGPEYERWPPVFQLYPADYNLLTNSTVWSSDSIYIMGKNLGAENYTLCELKSWLSPNCSTRFDVSGRAGARMSVNCEDPDDEDIYLHSFPEDQGWASPNMDWRWLADGWRLSMDLNGGAYNNNASNARFLTQLALDEPKLPSYLPSMAEALAVYASSTLVLGSTEGPFRHYWDWEETILDPPGPLQAFNATIRTQQYTSGHVSDWQSIFYVVFVLVFAINLFCLIYLILRSGLVTDFTEPQNLFALAVNSPPSAQLKGSCGAGPVKRDLVVPWRVAYAPSANHYFFEEANSAPWKGKYADQAVSTAREYGQAKSSSYRRLSSNKTWI